MTSLYAPDPGSAESQKHNAKSAETSSSYPPKRVNGHDNPDVGSGSPYCHHYEPTAEIWKLYLKETEAEDMELAQLWQIGLDQLLIFAGLFGAILTAFLIESRKDLKADPLQQILQVLSNDSATSTAGPFLPTKASLVVNAVWFSSLGLTLISALAAVLAKGWLAQYTPATPGVRSNDACERHLRYLRSREWPLAAIVGGIPLLIQLALLLFAAGLVVFTAGDNFGISLVLLVMTVLTVCLYFLGTILPWLSPACPFQTTMSDFIPGVARNRRYPNSTPTDIQPRSQEKLFPRLKGAYIQFTEFLRKVRRKPGQVEIEADILAWMLTNSTNEKAIEEAVRAIAGANPTQYLRDALHHCGASEVLCERFIRYVQSTQKLRIGGDEGLRVEVYLYALLRIVEPCGEICANAQLLVKPGQVLHRWDTFVDYLQPLACALRIRLLLAADIDDHREQWDQTKRNLIKMSEMGLVPDIQRVLVRATLDGLRGGIQLQQVCAIILSKQFQIPAARKIIASFDQTMKPEHLVATRMMGLLKYSDNEVSEVILSGIGTLAQFAEFRESIGASIHQIIDLLKQHPRWNHVASSNTLAKLLEHAELRESIRASIPQIVEFLKDSTDQVCLAGSHIFVKLSEQAGCRDTIQAAIPQIVDLLKDKNNSDVRWVGAITVAKLSEQVEFRKSIRAAIPHIVEILMDNDVNVRTAGVRTLAKLSEQVEFRESIETTLPQILNFLEDGTYPVSLACAYALAKFSEQAEFREFIQGSIPHITDLLKDDNHSDAREAAASTLAKLSEQAELRQTIQAAIPRIGDFLKDNSWSLRSEGAVILAQLSEHVEFRESIRASIPHILNLLKDDSHVRTAGAYTLAKLLGQSEFRMDLRAFLPRITEFLNDNDSGVRVAGANAVKNLSESVEFRKVVQDSIPHVVDFLKENNDSDVRAAGADTLAKLSEQSEFQQSIRSSIPQIIDLVKVNNSDDVRRAGANALVKLSGQAELKESVGQALRTLIGHPTPVAAQGSFDLSRSFYAQLNLDDSSRAAAVHGVIDAGTMTGFQTYRVVKGLFMIADTARLCDHRSGGESFGRRFWLRFDFRNPVDLLANSSLFRPVVAASVPQIVDGLKDSNDSTVRTSAAGTLGKLSEQAAFRPSIEPSIPQIMGFLKDNSSDVRAAGARSLAKFSEQAEFRQYILASLHHIIASLHDKENFTRRAGAMALAKISEHAEFRNLIQASIPQIVDLLKDDDRMVSEEGADTLAKLSEQEDVQESIAASISAIIDLLKDNTGFVCGAAANTLANFSKQALFRQSIPPGVPLIIIDSLKGNNESDVCEAGANALAKFSEQTKFHESIRASIPLIIAFLKDDDWDVRKAGENTLAKFSEQAELRESIGVFIPQIVELLDDNSSSAVRGAAAKTLAKLSDHVEFRRSIRVSIPGIIDLLKDSSDTDAFRAGSDALGKLSEQAEFRDSIQAVIPRIVTLLMNDDLCRASANTLWKLSQQVEFQASIRAAIPQIADCLKEDNWVVCQAGANTLAKLSEKAEFREAVRESIPKIVDLLKNNDCVVRWAGAETLTKLWKQGYFRPSLCLPELRLHIPTLLMGDALDLDDVSDRAEFLAQLLANDYFRDKILETLIFTMKSLYSPNTDEQKRGVYIITVFEKHATFVPMLREIWAIYAFTQDVLTDASLEQTATLVNEMERYGILKSL